jgi:hypothetical protein
MKEILKLLVVVFCVFEMSFAQNIDSLSHIDYQALHSANLNDVWGYVDEFGNEYAIVGTSKGTSIVDISNPFGEILVFMGIMHTSPQKQKMDYKLLI